MAQPQNFPFIATFLALAGMALLMTLGAWQLQRLEWKQNLLSAIEAGAQNPMPLGIADLNEANLYQSGTLRGRFMPDNEILLQAKISDGEPGYHVITPFNAGGELVLVNRGWAPLDYKTSVNQQNVIKGMIRPLPRPNAFTPDNDPEAGVWFWLDLEALDNISIPLLFAQACDDALSTESYPDPCKVEYKTSNNHQQYAIFWFVMAGLLGLFYVLRFWIYRPE